MTRLTLHAGHPAPVKRSLSQTPRLTQKSRMNSQNVMPPPVKSTCQAQPRVHLLQAVISATSSAARPFSRRRPAPPAGCRGIAPPQPGHTGRAGRRPPPRGKETRPRCQRYEYQSIDVVLSPKADPGLTNGLETTFIRICFDRVRFLGAEQPSDSEGNKGERDGDDGKHPTKL